MATTGTTAQETPRRVSTRPASLDWSALSERQPAVALQLTVGGTLSDRHLLAFDASGWVKAEGPGALAYSNISAAVFFYPLRDPGLFLKGGLGGARLERTGGRHQVTFRANGWGGMIGAGYDIRVGANFSLTPFGNMLFGDLDDDSSMKTVQLGLGVTWH